MSASNCRRSCRRRREGDTVVFAHRWQVFDLAAKGLLVFEGTYGANGRLAEK